MSYPGIPIPDIVECDVWQVAEFFDATVSVACRFKTPGPTFEAVAGRSATEMARFNRDRWAHERWRMLREAFDSVVEQVKAHNAVILPVPND